MHIEEAIRKVMEGKKVRHSSWHKDNFLYFDPQKMIIIFYDWQYSSFQISPDMLTSAGWRDIKNPSQDMNFIEALKLLYQGKKIANDEDDSYQFLEFSNVDQEIYKRILVEKEFVIDHKALFSNEWIEVGEIN